MLKTSPFALSLFFMIGAVGCASSSAGPRAENAAASAEEDALEVSGAPRARFAKHFDRFDKNGDGVLDATEIAAMPKRARDHIADADTDKDGKITKAEAEAHIEKMKKSGKFAHRERRGGFGGLMKRFDKNGDKVLDATEIAAMPEKARERVLKADADSDGKVTVDELKSAMAKLGHERFQKNDKNADGFLTKDEVGDRRWTHMSIADANNDGKLSEDELIAARRDGKLKPPRGAWRHHKREAE